MTPFYDATLTEGGPGACGIGKITAGGCCGAYGLAQGFTDTVMQVALLLLRVGWRALRIVLSQCRAGFLAEHLHQHTSGAHPEVGHMISAEVPLMVRPRKTCKLQGPCGLLPAPPNHSSSHTALPCCHDMLPLQKLHTGRQASAVH